MTNRALGIWSGRKTKGRIFEWGQTEGGVGKVAPHWNPPHSKDAAVLRYLSTPTRGHTMTPDLLQGRREHM